MAAIVFAPRVLLPILLVCSLLGSACGSHGLYRWGSYEEDVYNYYKSPESEVEFRDHLKTMLDKARKKGWPPPPGSAAG